VNLFRRFFAPRESPRAVQAPAPPHPSASPSPAIASGLDPQTRIAELVERTPLVRQVLTAFGLHCSSCSVSSSETLAQGIAAHGLALEPVLRALDEALTTGRMPQISDADRAPLRRPPPEIAAVSRIGAVVPIVSGKGGVGKSFVTATLAVALRRQGLRVAILDADITGPSIPRLFGLREPLDLVPDPRQGVDAKPRNLFVPARSRAAIEIVSSNLLSDEEDAAMIWRGPILSGVIRQLYEQTLWSPCDVLLLDLPPGTSDAPLTVLQSLPVTGVVLVTMPQALATMIVRKAARFVQQLKRPVLGVIENMAYFEAPDTQKRYDIFGPSSAAQVADLANAPILAQLPIVSDWLRYADSGSIEELSDPRLDAVATSFIEALASQRRERSKISLL